MHVNWCFAPCSTLEGRSSTPGGWVSGCGGKKAEGLKWIFWLKKKVTSAEILYNVQWCEWPPATPPHTTTSSGLLSLRRNQNLQLRLSSPVGIPHTKALIYAINGMFFTLVLWSPFIWLQKCTAPTRRKASRLLSRLSISLHGSQIHLRLGQ